jgi:hypothetical protein
MAISPMAHGWASSTTSARAPVVVAAPARDDGRGDAIVTQAGLSGAFQSEINPFAPIARDVDKTLH